MVRRLLLTLIGSGAIIGAGSDNAAADEAARIEPPAARTVTEATRRANDAAGKRLPLSDQQDFKDARRGFIATIDGGVILNDRGEPAWDLSRYDFLKGDAPASVNPSLWRQAKLNANAGLFSVVDGVYQVRGLDLAVMTVIRGETGWILVDPLLSKETGAAALRLVNRELGERPVTAILLTHTHPDHFGGVRGIVSDEDVAAGKVKIFAPKGFTELAVNENILAGNAMGRRAQFQFGSRLTPGPTGAVDSGIGKSVSNGVIGFMQPTDEIAGGEALTIDGVDFEFVSAADTEAPAEFVFYLPQFRALHTAEIATGSMHNLLTLRGAAVRDALAWARRLDEIDAKFGAKSDVVMASHNWPTWGTRNVREYLAHQRDIYRYTHDQTLRLANEGYTMHEIADLIAEPEFMTKDFSVRGYYGTLNHNSKATYQRYFGWWDGNPANLNPLPPEETAKRYVELAGGAEPMLRNASAAYDAGDYRWVATVMNDLVFAQPDNESAKAFLASAYEQLGYQSESAIWRNYYLSAAEELRNGPPKAAMMSFANPDFIKATPTANYFDALAVQLDPSRIKAARLNFVFLDTGETLGVELDPKSDIQRATAPFEKPTVTVRLNRTDLDAITLGQSSFQSKIADGSITLEGDAEVFEPFLASHARPNPVFNIVTP